MSAKSCGKPGNPFKSNCGDWCLKKIVMAASFVAAVVLSLLDKPIEHVSIFLAITLGNASIVGWKEVRMDKNAAKE